MPTKTRGSQTVNYQQEFIVTSFVEMMDGGDCAVPLTLETFNEKASGQA